VIDCPSGGFVKIGRSRQRVRDLASLDKSAVQFCRRSERLRFFLSYLSKARLDDESRALLRHVVAYRRKQWPESRAEQESGTHSS
jgi:hypothetical protein